MIPGKRAQPSNCSHGCFNKDFCIHKDEKNHMLAAVEKYSQGEHLHFPTYLNYPCGGSQSWIMRRALNIRRVGERLV